MEETITRGELTNLCWEKIDEYCGIDNWLDEEILRENMNYAMELDKTNFVLEGVQKHLERLHVAVLPDDIKGIKKEITRRYKKMGITDPNRLRSVKDWLDGKSVPSPTNRENLYNLCLALEMDVEMTIEFFLKNYLTIPFNYKDYVDAVYFYGILHGKAYLEITAMLERIETKKKEKSFAQKNTKDIRLDVSEIEEEEKLIQYLIEYACGREQQFQTAQRKVLDLVQKNAELATDERKMKADLKRSKESKSKKGGELGELEIIHDNGEVNIKQLLRMIYGFEMQENYALSAEENKEKENSQNGRENKGEPDLEIIYETELQEKILGNQRKKLQKKDKEKPQREEKQIVTWGKNDKLPERFRKNFPKDEELKQIKAGKATAETYRKALILMNFYNYFCISLTQYWREGTNISDYSERYSKEKERRNRLEEFWIETNALLAECGFVQMYVRNPFDYVVLYCASAGDPLDKFRDCLKIEFVDDWEKQKEAMLRK